MKNFDLVMRYVENNEDRIPSPAPKEGLKSLFAVYAFPEDREVLGLDDITSFYQGLSDRFGYDVDVPEMTLYFKADALSKAGSIEKGKEILDYLIEVYPASANGYWGLANLHRERGERDQAILYYRKCLELIPNMTPARMWLDRLEEEKKRQGG